MTDLTCDAVRELCAELALGVLDAHLRADALAHVEQCARCQLELRSMGEVADTVLELAPPAEPPPGFESRVLERLRAAPQEGPPVGHRWRRTTPARVAAAAAVAIAIAAGGWLAGHGTGPGPRAPAAGAVTAAFAAHGGLRGEVVVAGGRQPWIAVAVSSDLGDQTLTCRVTERDGRTVTVDTYALRHGFGYWGAPIGVPASAVRRITLVDATGATVAAATLG